MRKKPKMKKIYTKPLRMTLTSELKRKSLKMMKRSFRTRSNLKIKKRRKMKRIWKLKKEKKRRDLCNSNSRILI